MNTPHLQGKINGPPFLLEILFEFYLLKTQESYGKDFGAKYWVDEIKKVNIYNKKRMRICYLN